MDENKVLIKNLLALSVSHGCDGNASKFARLINEKHGKEVIDRSYVSKILKNTGNITIGKLAAIAEALNVDAWQILHPLGFDENGRSRASGEALDETVLKRSIKYSRSASEELGIEDLDFEAEVAASSYISIASGEEEKLGINLAKLSKSYV